LAEAVSEEEPDSKTDASDNEGYPDPPLASDREPTLSPPDSKRRLTSPITRSSKRHHRESISVPGFLTRRGGERLPGPAQAALTRRVRPEPLIGTESSRSGGHTDHVAEPQDAISAIGRDVEASEDRSAR
jgi:hypothetical protein